MKAYLKHFFTLSTLITIVFGAYSYTQRGPEKSLKEAEARAVKHADDGDKAILDQMNLRAVARDREIADFRAQVVGSTQLIMNRLEKLDDHLYDMQRENHDQKDAGTINRTPNGG